MSFDSVAQWSIETATQPSDGWSQAAAELAEQAAELRSRLDQTVTFGGQRAAILADLIEVFNDVRDSGWDGYGAAPIAPETFRNAWHLAERLPEFYPVPSVGAEPDGHLTFEWYRNPSRLLSISISPEGDLHYAAMIGISTAYGTEPYFGTMPSRILELIGEVMAQ